MGRRENNIKAGSSGRGKNSGESLKGRGKGKAVRKNTSAGSRYFSKEDRKDFKKSSSPKRGSAFLREAEVLQEEAGLNIMNMKNTVLKNGKGFFFIFKNNTAL